MTLGAENERGDAGRDGRTLFHETRFSGANGDRENIILPVQPGGHELDWQQNPVDPCSAAKSADYAYILLIVPSKYPGR